MSKYKADPDKPDDWGPGGTLDLENMEEDDIKELWLNLFFWVARYRPQWLQDAIDRKRASEKRRQEEIRRLSLEKDENDGKS